jgi:hypothetical protein
MSAEGGATHRSALIAQHLGTPSKIRHEVRKPDERAVFYVSKILATGQFRFAARRRRELSSIDDDPQLSTGPSGEFVRHRDEVFYAADHRPIRNPELPQLRSIAATPFWTTLIDGTQRGWVFLGIMAFGALLILSGFSVVIGKGNGAGWIEVIFGLSLIITPVLLTAQKRRTIREAEQRRQKEHAERDERDRQLLAAYSAALDRLRDNPDDEALKLVRREREKLDSPYAIWGDAARATVLQVGFNSLAKRGPEASPDIAALMDRASSAAGLIAEDATGVKQMLYSTVLWHLLSDDRLGEVQRGIVRTIQNGFAIAPEHVPIDTASEEQFDRLRGIDHRSVPRCDAQLPLRPREYCIYSTTDTASRAIVISNQRLVIGGATKPEELLIAEIDDIEVDADQSGVTVRTTGKKRPIVIQLAEPIYFASLLSLATTLDERPKSFT